MCHNIISVGVWRSQGSKGVQQLGAKPKQKVSADII